MAINGPTWGPSGVLLKMPFSRANRAFCQFSPQLILVQLYPTAVRSCIPRKMADNVYTGFWIDWGKFRPPDSVR